VVIVDGLARRNIDNELETSSLTPIQPIGARVAA
jgi:UDP-sulfoquinovose synthase